MLEIFCGNPIHVLPFDGDYRIKIRSDGSDRKGWLDMLYFDGYFKGHAHEIMDQARLSPREDSPKFDHWANWAKFTEQSPCFRVVARDGGE